MESTGGAHRAISPRPQLRRTAGACCCGMSFLAPRPDDACGELRMKELHSPGGRLGPGPSGRGQTAEMSSNTAIELSEDGDALISTAFRVLLSLRHPIVCLQFGLQELLPSYIGQAWFPRGRLIVPYLVKTPLQATGRISTLSLGVSGKLNLEENRMEALPSIRKPIAQASRWFV